MKAVHNESTRVSVAIYKPIIEIIERVVYDYYGIPEKLRHSHTRKGTSIRARQRVHFFAREYCHNCSLHVIGLITGNGKAYDHVTVHHSCKRTLRDLELRSSKGGIVYNDLVNEINELRDLINQAFRQANENTVKRCPCCNQII
jgi:chromosomal replication initiation ATPase DnaA